METFRIKTGIQFFLGLAVFVFTASCGSNTTRGAEGMEVTGMIQQQGISTYQYGTHTLGNSQDFYALTSELVDLDEYIGEKVTLMAVKIEGYPVDGGPAYLRVLEVVEE